MANSSKTTSQEDPAGSSETSTSQVGALLRATRLRHGGDLPTIAATLRIRHAYLEAIEEGRFSDLPGPAYAVGFVRGYAEHLGLDSDEVVRRFKAEAQGLGRRAELEFPAPSGESGLPGGALILMGVVLAAGAYGVWYWVSSSDRNIADLIPGLPDRLESMVSGGEAPPVPDETAPGQTPPVQTATPEPAAPETAPDAEVAEQAPAATDGAAEGDADRVAEGPEEPPAPEPAPVAEVSAEPIAEDPVAEAPVAEDPVAEDTVAEDTVAEAPTAQVTEPERETDTLADQLPVDDAAPADQQTAAEAGATPSPESDTAETATPEAEVAEVTETAEAEEEERPSLAPTSPPRAPAEKPGDLADAGAEDGAEDGDTDAVNVETAEVEPEPEPATEQVVQGAAAGQSRVTITATDATWVQIGSDGMLEFSGMLRSGESYRVPSSRDLTLTTGNAGVLRVILDGEPLGALGPVGEIRRDVSLQPDRLRLLTSQPN